MSAYAALLSLRQILEALLNPRPHIIHNTAQFRSLLEETGFLLNFLDASSNYKESQLSALETNMRDAAHRAEDLIEYGIIDRQRRRKSYILMECFVVHCVQFMVVYLLSGKVGIQFFLAEVVMCAIYSVSLYLHIGHMYVLPTLNDSQELDRVLYDFKIILKDVLQIQEAHGEPGMSARAALISLQQMLNSILDSPELWISRHRAHLECLHQKVSFLLDFLGNASAYNMLTLQNLDATIRDASYKAKKALIQLQNPSNFRLGFGGLISVPSIDFLKNLVPVAFIHMVYRIGLERFIRQYIRGSIRRSIRPSIRRFVRRSVRRSIPRSVRYSTRQCIRRLPWHWQVLLWYASFMVGISVVLVVLAVKAKSEVREKQELRHTVDDLGIIVEDVIKIMDAFGNPSKLPAAAASSRQDSGGASKDVVVGLDSELIEIKARLLQHSSRRKLVSIVGMGGIGKTTLARQVYKDLDFLTHFDVRAWVTVSQEYSLRHVLLCLLDSTQMLTEEKRRDNEEELGVHLYQYLTGRRYLIVMDDVWDTEIWDFLSRFLPENFEGSRVLLTSRLPSVVRGFDSSSPLHHMQCLDENESWHLLCELIFGEKGCPIDLESIGKEIAATCRGLPLAIVVAGGLLYKDIQIEVWREVADKLKKSKLLDVKEQCLEILGLSYSHLPHHLRPCFLYMGVFLPDCEIPVSRLINLWVAQGFLQSCGSETLEEVAECYLKDLIDRNLILICKRSCNGKIRTCSIHDLLRDVCIQNARKENFLHFVDSEGERPDESPRRLSIHPDALQVNATNELMKSYDSVRSVVCITGKPVHNPLVAYLGFVCLRVLHVLEVHFVVFPHQIIELVLLRYLALHYDGPLPASISKLKYLETIVHHHSSSPNYPLLASVIFGMPNLRHVYVKPGCYLFNHRLASNSRFPQNLQTLVGIRNFKWTKVISEKLPNLKKLGISYDVSSWADLSAYQLETLVDLHQLETLKIIVNYDDDIGSTTFDDPPKLAFPQKLRKLSLSGCRFPWASMTFIGALPNLEALKLRREAFCGPSWETVEGEFPQLMFLLLEEMSFTRWESDEAHFPHLQRLVLRSCDMLGEIPSSIGDIPTLEMIHLADCHPSAVASAKQIQEDQESMGNESLKFHIERRREVHVHEHEMDLRNLDVREMGTGVIQVFWDAIQWAKYDEITIFLATPIIIIICITMICFLSIP